MKAVLALVAVLCVGLAQAEWVVVWEDNFDTGRISDRWNFEVNCAGSYFLFPYVFMVCLCKYL